jgi:hypothetical protein
VLSNKKGVLDESFDVVLCLWSAFHELLAEEEQFQALSEMHRVLRSPGWCLIEGPLYSPATDDEVKSGKRYGSENRISLDVISGMLNPHYYHDPDSFKRLMKKAGIESFRVSIEDWAGRPRQFLRFEK